MSVRVTWWFVALTLTATIWGLGVVRQSDPATAWIRPHTAGPVRIIRFYPTVGMLTAGEKAMLCYGVENARTVQIRPLLEGVIPAANRCLQIEPRHTTHYTILAEGYDGRVETRSFTLPVEVAPPQPEIERFVAGLRQHHQLQP